MSKNCLLIHYRNIALYVNLIYRTHFKFICGQLSFKLILLCFVYVNFELRKTTTTEIDNCHLCISDCET